MLHTIFIDFTFLMIFTHFDCFYALEFILLSLMGFTDFDTYYALQSILHTFVNITVLIHITALY